MEEQQLATERGIEWEWMPKPPETLVAYVQAQGIYAFECVGTVPADGDEGGIETLTGDGTLSRVWIPFPIMNNIPEFVIDELEERHGVFAEKDEYKSLDGYTGRGSQL